MRFKPVPGSVDALSACRPSCPVHPKDRVRCRGYYGKDNQLVRWECVPSDGSRPHRFRPALSIKMVGGRSGCCTECDREWEPTDGMVMGTGDRFTLREKAATLVRLAQGASYREASHLARTRGGYAVRRRGVLVASPDGRLARDWVSQYAPLLADRFLPRRWPRVLVLDKLPVHTKLRGGNLPRQWGTTQFHIFGALSYINGRSTIWRTRSPRARPELAGWSSCALWKALRNRSSATARRP